MSAGTTNVNFADSGPNDHGAYFTFSFGALAAGESKTFNIFYGAADSEANAFSALSKVGAEVYSFGQSNTVGGPSAGTPSTFIFAFSGVGGTPVSPVPEPETYAMLLAGLSLVGFAARRKNKIKHKIYLIIVIKRGSICSPFYLQIKADKIYKILPCCNPCNDITMFSMSYSNFKAHWAPHNIQIK